MIKQKQINKLFYPFFFPAAILTNYLSHCVLSISFFIRFGQYKKEKKMRHHTFNLLKVNATVQSYDIFNRYYYVCKFYYVIVCIMQHFRITNVVQEIHIKL